MEQKDSIVALATPPGRSAIAVIRLSGPDSFDIFARIIPPAAQKKITHNKLLLIKLCQLKHNRLLPIDECMVAPYFAPQSYTGENVIEIFCHGNIVIANLIIQSLIENGARIARPGEFTERAFLNGKVDLAQAEAIDALINASTQTEILLIHNQYSGQFSRAILNLRQQLLDLLSLLELELDFSEEDVEFASRTKLSELLNATEKSLMDLLNTFQRSHIIRDGFKVSIVGQPNVGKSSLLNLILKKERAIVTDIAGTTRDIISEQVDINGYKFVFNDTAGIHQTDDIIEKEGIRRSWKILKSAELVFFMVDSSKAPGKNDWDLRDKLLALQEKKQIKIILLLNKIDLAVSGIKDKFANFISKFKVIQISCIDNTGFDKLESVLLDAVKNITEQPRTPAAAIINERQKTIVADVLICIGNAKKSLATDLTQEFIAADIRHAVTTLGELTGEITIEDVLSQIFSKFCIGK